MGGFNIGSLFSGIGSFLGGQAQAEGYEEAAKFYKEAARISLVQGKLKNLAVQRSIYQVEGAGKAAAGAGNIQLSGSVKDVIASNRQQGYLTKAVNTLNARLEYKSYMAQAKQAEAQANAAETSGIFGLIGGVLGMFSDDDVKENIEFVGRRGDGIGVFTWNYKGGTQRFEGVLASEIEVLRPDALGFIDGYRVVDYEKLDMKMRAL